jgi:hypothetical protein
VDSGSIGCTAHQPVKRVNLSDKVSFSQSSNRRIARHRANLSECLRDERHLRPTAGRRCRRLCPCVATADYDNVKLFHVEHSFAKAEPAEESV